MSAVSLYYYLQVLKQIYIVDKPVNAAPLKTPVLSQVLLGLLALLVLVRGGAPDPPVNRSVNALHLARPLAASDSAAHPPLLQRGSEFRGGSRPPPTQLFT